MSSYSLTKAQQRVEDNTGSLEEICKEAVCCAEINLMLAMGFPKEASEVLCKVITQKAKKLGITDLREHYESSVSEGKSNIINLIIRFQHKLYFATRAKLSPIPLLRHLSGPCNDLCAALFSTNYPKHSRSMEKRRALLDALSETQYSNERKLQERLPDEPNERPEEPQAWLSNPGFSVSVY